MLVEPSNQSLVGELEDRGVAAKANLQVRLWVSAEDSNGRGLIGSDPIIPQQQELPTFHLLPPLHYEALRWGAPGPGFGRKATRLAGGAPRISSRSFLGEGPPSQPAGRYGASPRGLGARHLLPWTQERMFLWVDKGRELCVRGAGRRSATVARVALLARFPVSRPVDR